MACKPITDQQVRLYMTDRQTHSQRTHGRTCRVQRTHGPPFRFRVLTPIRRCHPTARLRMGAPSPTLLKDIGRATCLPLLDKDSALQAITLRHLQGLHPLAFPDDRIRRTLERRIRQWRALNGPERDIIFRQTSYSVRRHIPSDPGAGIHGPLFSKAGLTSPMPKTSA